MSKEMINKFSRISEKVNEIVETKYTTEERELMKKVAKRDSKEIDAKAFTYSLERKLKGGIR